MLQWSFVIRWGVCNGRMVIAMADTTNEATAHLTLLHVHMQLNPKRGRCEFRPTFRVIPERWEG